MFTAFSVAVRTFRDDLDQARAFLRDLIDSQFSPSVMEAPLSDKECQNPNKHKRLPPPPSSSSSEDAPLHRAALDAARNTFALLEQLPESAQLPVLAAYLELSTFWVTQTVDTVPEVMGCLAHYA